MDNLAQSRQALVHYPPRPAFCSDVAKLVDKGDRHIPVPHLTVCSGRVAREQRDQVPRGLSNLLLQFGGDAILLLGFQF